MVSSPENSKKRRVEHKKRAGKERPVRDTPSPKPLESTRSSGTGDRVSTRLHYAWIIVSLAALGVVLSLFFVPGGGSAAPVTANPGKASA